MKGILIIALLLCSAFLLAEIQLNHVPVVSLTHGDPLVVSVEVRDGLEEVKEIKLFLQQRCLVPLTFIHYLHRIKPRP